MSSPAAPVPPVVPVTASSIIQTIESDLAAGESWVKEEVLTESLAAWNYVKGLFVALAPSELALATTVLKQAIADAQGGKTIEQIWSDALNTTVAGELAILQKLGTTAGLQLIAGIQGAASAAGT